MMRLVGALPAVFWPSGYANPRAIYGVVLTCYFSLKELSFSHSLMRYMLLSWIAPL